MNDHEFSSSQITENTDGVKETSVNQARWVLLPLFGLWFLSIVAGGIVR